LHFEKESERALPLAEQALAHPELAGADRCVALFVAAAENLKREKFAKARELARELVTLRRFSDDWLLLADCEEASGNAAASLEALVTAARINPRLANVHRRLARHFRAVGDPARAAWHEDRCSGQ
jgi:hypothetical protein